MAYKPYTWVITKQASETFAIQDKYGEIAEEPAMGQSDTFYEVYKTDEDGLRADTKYGIREFRTYGDARRALINLVRADEGDVDPSVCCPYCGYNLSVEMGETLTLNRIIFPEGAHAHEEVGDTDYHFCPDCGRKLDDKFADKIYEKFYE